MRVRLGRALLYGTGLTASGAGLYSFHKAGYDTDNVGKIKRFRKVPNIALLHADDLNCAFL